MRLSPGHVKRDGFDTPSLCGEPGGSGTTVYAAAEPHYDTFAVAVGGGDHRMRYGWGMAVGMCYAGCGYCRGMRPAIGQGPQPKG